MVLEKDFELDDLPEGSRFHLRLAASRPATVRLEVEVDGHPLERTLELDSSEQSVVVDLPAGDLGRARISSQSRTTLSLRYAAISVP